MKSKYALAVMAVGMPLVLAGCGETTGDRAASGAAIGAGTGAVIGAVTPVGPLGGALIGGAVGGATGALTSPSQVDLGKPIWRHGQTSAAGDPMLRDIQSGLQRQGYNPGAADGRFGPQTETAIRRYQQDHGMAVDGQPSEVLHSQLSG